MGMGKGNGKGKEKRKQVTIPADRDSKRPRVDDGASSSNSAPLENGGGPPESPEDVISDQHSVFKEPPPPQESTQFVESQGKPPTGGSKWNFNLEESPGVTPGGTLELPSVPADWRILEALPPALPPTLLSSEEIATLPEALLNAMLRCCSKHRKHRMVG